MLLPVVPKLLPIYITTSQVTINPLDYTQVTCVLLQRFLDDFLTENSQDDGGFNKSS